MSWGGASSCDARSWSASVVLRFGERVARSFGETSETKCANRCFRSMHFSVYEVVQTYAVMSICGMRWGLCTLPRPWLILVWSVDKLEGAQWFVVSRGVAFAFGAERAARLVGIGVCSWSDSGSVEYHGGCLGVKPRRVAGMGAHGGRLRMV